MSNEVIIVQVGAEGGNLALYGVRIDDGWLFSLNVYDCSLLLLDEDQSGAASQYRSSPVTSWSDALALLDRYPWATLHPLHVHPEFRKKVWNEVQRRLGRNEDNHAALTQWREICEMDTADTENWLDSYYDGLEFIYWEPQHMVPKTPATTEFEMLAKIAEKSSKIDRVRRHLRKMEVTLNHNIRQFFLLAPDALRNKLFEKTFGQAFESAFVMHGREIDTEFELRYCMQPDFLFVSEEKTVSIEMKVKHKCSIEQVLKYALLGLAVELKQGRQKEHYHILLGKGVFASLFKERFESIEKLTEAVGDYDLSLFLKNKPRHLRELERFSQIAKQIHIEFVTYQHLAGLLEDAAPKETDQSLGAQVYRKAIFGLVDEFTRRELL